MLAGPAGLAVAWGISRLATASGTTMHMVRADDGLLKMDSIPTPEKFDLLFLILWTAGLYVLLGGLITGWVWLHRSRPEPWVRSRLLTLVALIASVVPIWAWGEVSSPRLEGAVMLIGSAAATIAAYLILEPRRSGRPSYAA